MNYSIQIKDGAKLIVAGKRFTIQAPTLSVRTPRPQLQGRQ